MESAKGSIANEKSWRCGARRRRHEQHREERGKLKEEAEKLAKNLEEKEKRVEAVEEEERKPEFWEQWRSGSIIKKDKEQEEGRCW